ncbi:MAG: LysR family transcriptional regulator [Oceanospirillaceae bacterium]
MVKLTIKQCTYFVAVAEQGGIAQASRVLNISQPAVAQAIDKLEHVFKFRLFERHHARGTELTPQGRAFLESARSFLLQAEQTQQDAQAIAANMAGIIRLGCFHTIAPYYLPSIISAYKKEFPNVKLVPSELQQDEIVESLAAGNIDLAITYDMSLQHYPIECQLVTQLKPFILVNRDHPCACESSIGLEKMAQEPFVMFEGHSSSEYFEDILASRGITPIVAYRSKSMESVRSAVANGLGFSLAVMQPQHGEACDANNVVQIAIKDDIEPLAIVIIRKKNAPISRQVEKLASFCEGYFHNNASTSK